MSYLNATHSNYNNKGGVTMYLLLAFLCGIIGVLTVIFNIFALNSLGAALLTALSLLGQILTSIILENNGWLGAIKRKITLSKCLSLGIIAIGIGVMFQ